MNLLQRLFNKKNNDITVSSTNKKSTRRTSTLPLTSAVKSTITTPLTERTRWTPDEDNIVIAFHNFGMSAEYICDQLAKCGRPRTSNAVYQRIYKLNKKLNK